MNIVDKVILFVVKMVGAAIIIGAFSNIFIILGMEILKIKDTDGTLTNFQYLFMSWITGMPTCVVFCLYKFVKRLESEYP